MLRINPSKQAIKFLEKAQPKHAKQISKKLMEMRLNPFPHDSIQLKGEHSHLYRADIGEYRIIYHCRDGVLFINIIGKRNDGEVYKLLKR